MSGQCTGWVLRHGPKPTDVDQDGRPYGAGTARAMRSVLAPIADAANRDGEHAHPGLQAIIEWSLYSRAHVLAMLAMLVEEGWLEVEQKATGPGSATVYRVVMDRPAGDRQRVQKSDPLDSAKGPIQRPNGSNPRAERVQKRGPAPYSPTVSNNGSPNARRRATSVEGRAQPVTTRRVSLDLPPPTDERERGPVRARRVPL